jgi:hypothetical protein
VTASRWWCPDQGFTPRQLEQARAFIARAPSGDRIVAALAAGSPAAGLGHARSDLDLLLIFPDESAQAAFDSLPRQFEGATVDVKALTLADLERQGEAVRKRDVADTIDRTLYGVGNLPAWMLLTRLVSGVVLRATPEARGLLAALDRHMVRRSMMVVYALHLGSYVEDAEGSLESGDLATALAASEDTVRAGAEIALAAAGDVYIGPKFLRRRLARHPHLAALLDEHGVAMLGQPAASCGDDEVRRLVRWRLWLAGHLAGQSLRTGWDAVVDALPPFRVLGDGPIRSPYRMPVRWPGGLGLMSGVVLTSRFSGDDAVLWGLLDGRALEDVRAAYAEHSGQPPAEAAAHVRRTIDEWRNIGAI